MSQVRKSKIAAPALEKGLDIIELLAAEGRPMTMREVAEHLGRSKNEIFRMVHVLIERGYAIREGAEGLALTDKLFDLGLKTPRMRNLVAIAMPMVLSLAREIRQSVHLVVANRGETVVVASASGSADMDFSLKLGYRRPLVDAHSGLVMLALQPEELRDRLIAESMSLMQRPPDRDAIENELELIRRDGHIVRDSRDLVGVTDLAAPIVTRSGEAIASLSVIYLKRREVPAEHEVALQALKHTGRQLADQLEGTGSARGVKDLVG